MIAFVIGCSKEEEELPKLELNATELSFKSEGGDELVGVTSNTNWSAVSSEKWCEVSPASSKGDGAIKVTAQKNEKRESRTAKISVVSGSLTRIVVVSQVGAGSENGSGGNNEEGGNGSGNENGGSNGSNNDGGDTPTPTVTYQVTLTSSLTVGGTVTGGGSYEKGKVVTISASANSGYKFVKWSDGNTSSIRTITVTGNQSLMAYFEIVRYTVTLTSSPIVGGTVTGGGSYEKGKVVTISASANSGYKFVKWDDGETSASRTFTVNGNRSLTAYFEQNPVQQYSITLSKSPSAGGTVYGGGTYEEGKIVTITATPASGYEFTKWSDGVTTNPRTLTVTANKTLTAYFEQKSSNPSSGVAVNGKLPGKFSVSATKQVSFAMGNLQCKASTDTWRFAENQYDVIGYYNENNSATYSGWIDLFGWGTSGYDGKYPYMTRQSNYDYGNGYSDIARTNYDWGVYNAISNGGNKAGMWRTLTYDEWSYLFKTRTNALNLRGQATVNGQTGYILLPDVWSAPSSLKFTANPDNFTTNRYSASEWSKMEAAGAVFLPCAGDRYGTVVHGVGSYGYYWSSTASHDYNAGYFSFYWDGDAGVNYSGYRYAGYSVRLATE